MVTIIIHNTHSLSQITRSVFGELLTINLVKDGANKLVTMETRDEYCAAFVDYTFNASVKAQFDAFKEGFMKVCDGKVLVSLCVCTHNTHKHRITRICEVCEG